MQGSHRTAKFASLPCERGGVSAALGWGMAPPSNEALGTVCSKNKQSTAAQTSRTVLPTELIPAVGIASARGWET